MAPFLKTCPLNKGSRGGRGQRAGALLLDEQ